VQISCRFNNDKYKWMNDRAIIGRATGAQGKVAYDAYFLENSP
jgi:hypothetical protein